MTESATSKIHYSPLCEARWCYLIEPRAQMDESKPPAWSCDLLMPAEDAKTKAFNELLETALVEAHGTKKRRSPHALPLKPDKKDSGILVAKFKAQQLTRKDGTILPGPKVIDSRKQKWDGSDIGNGSKLIVAFKIHNWERPEGVGISLIPTAIQVVHFVPYIVDDGVDGFDEQADGYTVDSYASEFDEFAEEV
jgi:hypothetical protein